MSSADGGVGCGERGGAGECSEDNEDRSAELVGGAAGSDIAGVWRGAERRKHYRKGAGGQAGEDAGFRKRSLCVSLGGEKANVTDSVTNSGDECGGERNGGF